MPFNSALLRLRSECIAHITQFFHREGYTQTHPPIITSSDCEGAGEVFNVASSYNGAVGKQDDGSFFRAPKYLTVSTQLHLEALAQSVGKVWTLSPTFRAEKSDTARHLSEFYMLEAEISFTEDMDSVMDVVEDMTKYMTTCLTNSTIHQEMQSNIDLNLPTSDGAVFGERWFGIIRGLWPRITYTEAIKCLQDRPAGSVPFEHAPIWGQGLQAEHERYLAHTLGQGAPLFVTRYPKAIKSFYMLPSPKNDGNGQDTVECFDLLLPEVCEVVGGSMREHRLEPLLRSMQEKGMLPPGPISEITDEQLVSYSLVWIGLSALFGQLFSKHLHFFRTILTLDSVGRVEVVRRPKTVGKCAAWRIWSRLRSTLGISCGSAEYQRSRDISQMGWALRLLKTALLRANVVMLYRDRVKHPPTFTTWLLRMKRHCLVSPKVYIFNL